MDGEIEAIVRGLTRGERLHVVRLGDARPDGLARKTGWKARAVMVKGLSEWVDYHSGTERLTPLGLRVRQALETAGEGRRG